MVIEDKKLKIGLIGGGNVGGTLARRFLELGLEVRVGVPDPTDEKYRDLPAAEPAEAARFGDVVILATPWSQAESALRAVSTEIEGKILVDATNPIAADFSGLTVGHTNSGGQLVSGWAPKSTVVKAFNTIGFNVMASPNLNGQPTTLLIAGDDDDAKETVASLARAIGFSPLDVGGLKHAALTEASAWLWISLTNKLGRRFAFNLNLAEG